MFTRLLFSYSVLGGHEEVRRGSTREELSLSHLKETLLRHVQVITPLPIAYLILPRVLLLQVHALALIDRSSLSNLPSAIALLHQLYTQSDVLQGKRIIVSSQSIPSLMRDIHFIIPKYGLKLHLHVQILPLLEILGRVLLNCQLNSTQTVLRH